MKKLVLWFAVQPITIVAVHALFLGLVLSSSEEGGWNDWGHEASIVMVVPIVAWALLRWWLYER